MIGPVSGAAQTASSSAVGYSARPAAAPSDTAAAETSDTVALSPGGKLLSDLPPLILDPKVHMANAEKRLAALMEEMGIPANTKIDITVSSSGRFTIDSDNEKLAELESRLNDGSEMELRNSLIGAHSSATIQRIAAAAQNTAARVEADPAHAETLWNQMLATADSIKNQSMAFSYAGGRLGGTFSDGTILAFA